MIESNNIKMLEDDYYFVINKNYEITYYKELNEKMAEELKIENVKGSIEKYIKELNTYNEIKDIVDAMVGKIAEYRGISIVEMREELELDI